MEPLEFITFNVNFSSHLNSAVEGANPLSSMLEWMFGVTLLFVALFLSSLLGHVQVHNLDEIIFLGVVLQNLLQ